MFLLQNKGLPKDPVDLEIDPDYVGSGLDIRDNEDEVDGEDTKADGNDEDNGDEHDRHDNDDEKFVGSSH